VLFYTLPTEGGALFFGPSLHDFISFGLQTLLCLFPTLKQYLGGNRFKTDNDLTGTR
jgi:hypothetical protein